MSDVLAIHGARKVFGSTTALDGAELSLKRGEWLGLLGPNGAGKTTLVKSIAGRVRLDAGTMTLLGEPISGTARGDSDVRERLGVVPQDLALYPALTARENLEAFAALHGIDRSTRRDRVNWALDWTGLADRAREPVKRFSGGMKRRLNIACSILHEPEVILLDEPTVGVDPQSRQRIWEMLRLLQEGGASLLLTTHQLDEAQQVCERIVIIDHGRSIADGPFQELVEQTIGTSRRIQVEVDGETVFEQIDDVAAELPALLDRLRADGKPIGDIHVESPTLQAVFIHLTGRELRE